ncbi:hypothetical protein LCGC14_0698490 [marine sediment metagenome]|uniref:Uncharacterized protein n=1 Tax=marine sediment metagenome TaxID=412755 RepID=A0A0F9QII7_9ZZZZ
MTRHAEVCDECGGDFRHRRTIKFTGGKRVELCKKCARDNPYNVISDAPAFTLWGGSH